MVESELVVFFNIGNTYYCKPELFAYGSVEAKNAHDTMKRYLASKKNVVNISTLPDDEIDYLLRKIDSEISFCSVQSCIDLRMIVKKDDIYSLFNADGSCILDNLDCGTKEIIDLLKGNIKGVNEIKEVPYITSGYDEVMTGYMIPVFAYGGFFTDDEAYQIFSVNSIEHVVDGFNLQFALDPESINNLEIIEAYNKKKNHDLQNIIRFEVERDSMLENYRKNSKLIEELKRKKEDIIKLVSGRQKNKE